MQGVQWLDNKLNNKFTLNTYVDGNNIRGMIEHIKSLLTELINKDLMNIEVPYIMLKEQIIERIYILQIILFF